MSSDGKKLAFAKIKLKIALFIAVLIGIWIFGLSKYIDNLPRVPTSDNSYTDGIVILTGGTMRLKAGVELLHSGKAKRLFVSGVGKDTKLDRMLMMSGALPDNILELKNNIDLGYEAQNTHGNAIEVAQWTKQHNYKTIRLVTANYHMPRSYFELQTAMPDVKIIQNPVFPGNIKLEKWWNSGITKKIMFSEYNKYLVSRVTALID